MSGEFFNLDRYLNAQESIYQNVLAELREGRKRTHWMWFIFPQLSGLGKSEMAQFYAIKNLSEAQAYLRHPVLGRRLVECTLLVNQATERTLAEIFGSPDDLKFHSSMTLFHVADPNHPIFVAALEQYFSSKHDAATLSFLGRG